MCESDRKVALVTGAAKGIGRAIAIELAKKGMFLALVDKSSKALNNLSKQLKRNRDILPMNIDVTDKEATKKCVNRIIDKWGKIDILVNNAGGSFVDRNPLEKVTNSDWEYMIDLNLSAPFYWSRAVISNMKKRENGNIIYISSHTAKTGTHHLVPGYPAAKAGLLGLTRQLARELGPMGIRVNSIAPGLIMSNENVQEEWENYCTERKESIMKDIPLRRLGKPQDVAKVVCFLISKNSSYITGQVLYVNGGSYFG